MDVSTIRPFVLPNLSAKRWGTSPVEQNQHAEKEFQIDEQSTATDQLSKEETEFFTNLFPGSADAIRSYASYGKEGMKTPAHIGTLVDKKG